MRLLRDIALGLWIFALCLEGFVTRVLPQEMTRKLSESLTSENLRSAAVLSVLTGACFLLLSILIGWLRVTSGAVAPSSLVLLQFAVLVALKGLQIQVELPETQESRFFLLSGIFMVVASQMMQRRGKISSASEAKVTRVEENESENDHRSSAA